jgi:tetratricopeptide (TPR) repeat protein
MAIAAELARDPGAGARTWLHAWIDAVINGRWDEAERLTAEPFHLPPASAWWRDRLWVGLGALRDRDPERWSPISAFLLDAADRPGSAQVDARRRAALMLLEVRIRAQAGLDADGTAQARELVDRASALLSGTQCDVLAARSMLARHADHATDDASGSGASQATDWLAVLTGAPDACTASAVEVVHWLEAGDADGDAVMAGTRQAVAGLPLVGVEGAIDALIEPPSDFVWVGLAERYLREGAPEDASRLLGRGSDATGIAAAERERLALELARARGAPSPELADLLARAGSAAILAGRTTDAITYHEEALSLVDGHPAASIGLADALVVSVSPMPLQQSITVLERARGLVEDAHRRASPGVDDSWSLLVLAEVERRLTGAARPSGFASGWRAIWAAARALAFMPDSVAYWLDFANVLITAGRYRAADVVARLARLATEDPDAGDDRRLRALVNLGDNALGLAILEEIEERSGLDLAWRRAMRATFLAVDEPRRALEDVTEALRISSDPPLWYHVLRGDLLAATGDPKGAGEEWHWIWQHAELDEYEGLVAAARSALKQELHETATALADQVSALDRSPRDLDDGLVIRGLSAMMAGGNGWNALRTGIGQATTGGQLDDLQLLCRAVAAVSPIVDLEAIDAAITESRGHIASEVRDLAPGWQAVADLEQGLPEAPPSQSRPERPADDAPGDDPARLAARLAGALCLIADGDPAGATRAQALAAERPYQPELAILAREAPVLTETVASLLAGAGQADGAAAGDEPDGGAGSGEDEPDGSDDDVRDVGATVDDGDGLDILDEGDVQIRFGPAWFDGEHPDAGEELIRALLDAAAVAGRDGHGTTSVSWTTDATLEPDGYRITGPGRAHREGRIRLDRSYCPVAWLPGLSPAAQRAAVETSAGPHLLELPPPEPGTLDALIAWRPTEVVARAAIELYARAGAPRLERRSGLAALGERIRAWVSDRIRSWTGTR